MDVEDWEGVDQDILSGDRPRVHQRNRVRCEVCARQHRALWPPSRAGRIEHCGDCIGREFCPLYNRCVGQRGNIVECVRLAGDTIANEYRWFSILKKIGNFRLGIASVERHINRSNPQAGEIEDHCFGRFFDARRNTVSGFYASACQLSGHSNNAVIEHMIADNTTLGSFEPSSVGISAADRFDPVNRISSGGCGNHRHLLLALAQ